METFLPLLGRALVLKGQTQKSTQNSRGHITSQKSTQNSWGHITLSVQWQHGWLNNAHPTVCCTTHLALEVNTWLIYSLPFRLFQNMMEDHIYKPQIACNWKRIAIWFCALPTQWPQPFLIHCTIRFRGLILWCDLYLFLGSVKISLWIFIMKSFLNCL